jgi:hypothetical protein
MIKERTPSTECREAIRRLVDALRGSDDFEGAIDRELADLSDDAKTWAAMVYLNQAARESFRIVVRAAEIGAAAAGAEKSLIHGWTPARLRSQSALFKGCTCPPCSEWLASREKTDSDVFNRFSERIGEIMARAQQDFELRLTDTLLNSRFTLRDGTFVAWGDATAAQHGERMELFAELAESNLEGMARHAKAIELLRSHGVATLRQIR